jgi:hypothetical protein
MIEILLFIFNWSEVWALLIPLSVLLLYGRQPRFLKPVILYIWIALFINLAADIIGDFKTFLPPRFHSNNVLYNLHSLIRFTCFSLFFILLAQPSYQLLKKTLPVIFILFISVNFSLVEGFFNPDHLSGNLLSAEAYLLLVYCMIFYLSQVKVERKNLSRDKAFLVVTGLSIYVVSNFFVFLFYVPMIKDNPELAANMWYVHNVAYILLCVAIARAFYVPA